MTLKDSMDELIELQKKEDEKANRLKKIYTRVGILIAVIILFFVFLNPIVLIGAGKRGVVLSWGAVSERTLNEGLSFVIPIRDRVKRMDVTIQKVEVEDVNASSKDLQLVTSKITLNYKLEPLRVNELYQKLKYKYNSRVVAPAIQEFVKKTTAQYTAEELITKRQDVKRELRKALTENLLRHGIKVVDIFITDFNFSNTFNRAIEAKVTAEQKALEARNKLEEVKYQAAQRIEKAKAEAMAIRIKAKAITQQGGKDYVSLKAIEKWNGVLPVQMIPNATVPFINLRK